jgi:hypothetical protein
MNLTFEIEIGPMLYFCTAEMGELERANLEMHLINSLAHGNVPDIETFDLNVNDVKCLQMTRIPLTRITQQEQGK